MEHRKRPPRIAAGDLELLEMLWRAGPVTLAEAQQALGRPVGYTTVQTRLNRLVTKGLAVRSKHRPARYGAAVAREQVNRDDLALLVDRVNQGQVIPLMAQLVRDRSLTADEIRELKALIAEAEDRIGREAKEDAP